MKSVGAAALLASTLLPSALAFPAPGWLLKAIEPRGPPSWDNCKVQGLRFDIIANACIQWDEEVQHQAPLNVIKRGGEHKPSPTWGEHTTSTVHPSKPTGPGCPRGEHYDWHKKCCVPDSAPVPSHECPKNMLYDYKTKKCFSPSRHPSEENCKYLHKTYNAHTKQCEYEAPTPHCENPHEYYDTYHKKCLPIAKPAPAPVKKCEKDYYYDEAKKCCVKNAHPNPPSHYEPQPPKQPEHKPTSPQGGKPAPAPKPQPVPKPEPAKHEECKDGYYYSEDKHCCVKNGEPAPKPKACPKGMVYDPKTYKCFSPARHPSKENCAYQHLGYDEHTGSCVDKHYMPTAPKPEACPKGMVYDPKTYKCFSPALHPSKENCAYQHLEYDEHTMSCVDKHYMPTPPSSEPPMPVEPGEPHCEDPKQHYDAAKKACV